ncbi:ATP-dependent RNA helicase DBP5 [Neofusicoccum parvum]|nr:ATP-dependent RNA helicase DBP5 [Neofusicoccum parvum]
MLPSLGRPSCKPAKLIRYRSALDKGWNVIVDKPLSYDETVAIYLALCGKVLMRLKLSGELPNVVGNEQEDPRKAGIDYSNAIANAEPTGDLTHILFPDAELIDVEAARRALENCGGSDGSKTGMKAAVAISDDEHFSMVEKEKEKGPAIVIDSDSSSDSEDDLPLTQKNGPQNGKANGKGTFVNHSPGVGDSKPRAGNPPSFLSTAATGDYQANDDNSDSEDDIPLAHWNRLQNRGRSTTKNNGQEACSNNNIQQRGSSGYQNRSSTFEAWIKTTKNYDRVDDQTQFFLFGPWWDQHELNLAEQFLNSREPNSKKLVHHTGKAFFNPKVKYPKHDLKSRRPENLKHLFDKLGNVQADRKAKILILCRSHGIVDALWRHVSTRGVAKRTHLTDRIERDSIVHQWDQGMLRALVTTEDLAEGLTMRGVTEVVHWELPRHENLNVAEWKYVRGMDRVRDEVERTSVFFADEDVDLFQLVAKVATGFLHCGNIKAHHAWVYRSYMRREWGFAVEEKPKWKYDLDC